MPLPLRSARAALLSAIGDGLPAPLRHNIPDLPKAEELLPWLRQMDAVRWYSNFGPLVRRFEESFARAMEEAHGLEAETLHVLTLSSGYHALVAGLATLGLRAGARILMPAVTFPACPLAALHLGMIPMLADVDPNTALLTPEAACAIAARTRLDAVMPVALYGVGLPAEAWDAFQQETGIPVLVDAAAAVETQRYPRHGAVAHSLHALKPFGVGEGGLLVSRDRDRIEAARRWSSFGMVDGLTRGTGENAKMSEYHAAVALAQLTRWAEIKARRHAVLREYQEVLANEAPALRVHPGLADSIPGALMLHLPDAVSATACMEALRAHHVAAHRTYLPPLFLHPRFADLPCAASDGAFYEGPGESPRERLDRMPGSATLQTRLLGLPFHAFVTPETVRAVVAHLNAVLETGGRLS